MPSDFVSAHWGLSGSEGAATAIRVGTAASDQACSFDRIAWNILGMNVLPINPKLKKNPSTSLSIMDPTGWCFRS